jgi:hypothetical protein
MDIHKPKPWHGVRVWTTEPDPAITARILADHKALFARLKA